MSAVRRITKRVVAISSADVYRAYGRLHGSEPGATEPVPLTEDAPLRERLYPYRGEFGGRLDDYDKIPVERAFSSEPDVRCTILRLPAVYGEATGSIASAPSLRAWMPVARRSSSRRSRACGDGHAGTWATSPKRSHSR